MDDHSDTAQTEGRRLAVSEIEQLVSVVNEVPNVPLAQVWVPCKGCFKTCECMERAFLSHRADWKMHFDLRVYDFLMACFHHKLKRGKGVVGRAFSSLHKSCLVQALDITEYPLAHYARRAMFAASFAVCLQSAHTGSDPYVLEFFMAPDNEGPRTLIQSLMLRMKRQLVSFRVASGKQLGEELVVEIARFGMDDDKVCFQKSPSDRYPLRFEVSSVSGYPADAEERGPPLIMNSEHGGGNVDSSTQAGNTSTDVNLTGTEGTMRTYSIERETNRTSLQISYSELQSQFGKPIQQAADVLGVSRSTLKRSCRSHNISRWPYHSKNKANHSLFKVNSADKPGQNNINSSGSNRQDETNNPGSITMQDHNNNTTGLVTIKANYQSKTVKFFLSTSCGKAKLEEELAKRLKLKIGDFEMSYQDEDGSFILLTCDEDLRFCTETLTLSGLTTIQVSVQSVSL